MIPLHQFLRSLEERSLEATIPHSLWEHRASHNSKNNRRLTECESLQLSTLCSGCSEEMHAAMLPFRGNLIDWHVLTLPCPPRQSMWGTTGTLGDDVWQSAAMPGCFCEGRFVGVGELRVWLLRLRPSTIALQVGYIAGRRAITFDIGENWGESRSESSSSPSSMIGVSVAQYEQDDVRVPRLMG